MSEILFEFWPEVEAGQRRRPMAPRVAVILSGCGVLDGSEIHEATLALLFLDRSNCQVRCFAPNKAQSDVVDHVSQKQVSHQDRNVLVEAARIARGKIEPLSGIDLDEFDAVILPGGYGAAKNLCTFALDGAKCEIDHDVAAVIQEAVAKRLVLGAICISPVVVARALRDTGVRPTLTVGSDRGTMDAIEQLQACPVKAKTTDCVVDKKNRIVSTPAYMLAERISEVAEGVEKLVKSVLALVKKA